MKPTDDATVRQQGPAAEGEAPIARYRVTAAGDTTELIIDGGRARALVGQGPACDLKLSDPLVSRRHLALDVTPQGLKLADLGSTNGTWINGVQVIEAVLRGGEDVKVGNTALRIEALAAAAPLTPQAMRFGRLIGGSPQMRRLYPLCERLAKSDVPVVLEGETGCGKELLAEALHETSARAGGPFVVFDCTAVPPSLMESELFGHEKGAFTGAAGVHRGVFEQAHGGTLLIDEIGDLELSLQAKLLRAIERSEIKRLGGEQVLKVDVRIIAATRRDLDREVQAGRFRDDLFFRLAVARVELPPLRERTGDVGLLARHFWRSLGGGDRPLPPGFLERAQSWGWPGNVRELRNVVARTLALGELADQAVRAPPAAEPKPPATPAAGTDFIDSVVAQSLPFPAARDRVQEEFERRYVEQVLARYAGNVTRAAAASGIARRYFQLIRGRSGQA